MTRTRLRGLAGAAVMAGLLAAMVIMVHNLLTAPYPGLNDFMSRWEGARAYWLDGLNPYGDEATRGIQQRIYGRPALEDEDPGLFAYPLYTVYLVWPLVYLPYAWASAVWMVLLAASVVASLFLLFDLFRWRPAPILLAALVLWSLMFYFAARGFILGQPGVLVAFLQILVVWALARDRDGLAGVALVVSTIKPQMGFLLVPFLLLWALAARRWRFVGTFGLLFGGLLAVSFLAVPGWLGDWLGQLALYPSYTALGSPVWIVTQFYLGLGGVGEYLVIAGLVGLMLWVWYGVLVRGQRERWLWAVALTLTVTHLIAPRTATPHYVIFLLPLVFWFSRLGRHRGRAWWTALVLLALLVVPWLHFLATVAGEFEHPTVYLPLPFGVLLLLWVTRRTWWEAA